MNASLSIQARAAIVVSRVSSARKPSSITYGAVACTPATRRPALRLRFSGRQNWSMIQSRVSVKRQASGADASVGDEEEDEDETAPQAEDSPISAAEALEWGQARFDKGEFESAKDLFREVFTLPGSGSMRYQGRLKELSCASEGEINAALYNMACCFAKMGRVEDGLQAMSDCMENGFDNYEAFKTDPDLQSLRQSPDFDKVIGKYDNVFAKIKGKKSDTNKSWLDRW